MHLTLEFRGGLELLFGSPKKHEVDVVPPNGLKEVTMESLLAWIKENLLKERPEMFLKENSVSVVKMDNYCKEFRHIDPLQSYKPWVKNETTVNDMLMPANERQIAAVFVCSDPID